jgi:multicomponent Na+:H+ antiporter subunit D
MNTWLLGFLFAPLIIGVLIYAFENRFFNRIIFVLQGSLSIFFILLLDISPYSFVLGGWPNTIGIECVIDPISLLFVGMTLVGFWFIYLYDWAKGKNDPKYLFLICTLQSVMLSLFVVYDLFTIFILIELMTIIASILITYKKDSHSVKAGIYYLLINSMGMILYIIGVMILYSLTGSLNIHVVQTQLPLVMSNQLFKLAMAFIISSIAVKSALFPLFHWLPIAHSAAPGSISAILSGLIVKAGLFLLLRMSDIFHSASLGGVMLGIGILTALSGAILAMLQYDIKRLLSFSTVSHIGLILIGFSLPGAIPYMGGLLHLLNHFLFKSLLFLCVGLIINQTGERNLKRIHGLWKTNPVLSVALMIGIMGIVGFPMMNGQLSKILIKAGAQDMGLKMLLYVVNVGTVISFLKLSQVFFGPAMKTVVDTKNRQSGVYLMAGLTLLAFPLEFLFLKNYEPYVYLAVAEKWLSSSLEFIIQFGIAMFIYMYVLVPALRQNWPIVKEIKKLGVAYFGEAVALLLGFIGFLHLIMTNS